MTTFTPSVKQSDVLASIFEFNDVEEMGDIDDYNLEDSQLEEDISINPILSKNEDLEAPEMLINEENILTSQLDSNQWKNLCFSLLKRQKNIQDQLQLKTKEVDRLRNRALQMANTELKEQMERLDTLTNQLSNSYNRCDFLEGELLQAKNTIHFLRQNISTLRRDFYSLKNECKGSLDAYKMDLNEQSKAAYEGIQTIHKAIYEEIKGEMHSFLKQKVQQQLGFIENLNHQVQALKRQQEKQMKDNQFDPQEVEINYISILRIQEELNQNSLSHQSLLHNSNTIIDGRDIQNSFTSNSSINDHILEERFCQIQFVNTQLLKCCEEQQQFISQLDKISNIESLNSIQSALQNSKERTEALLGTVHEVLFSTLQTADCNNSVATTKSRLNRQKLLNSASIMDELTRKYITTKKLCQEQYASIQKLKEQKKQLKSQQINSEIQKENLITNDQPNIQDKDSIDQISNLIQHIVQQTSQMESTQKILLDQIQQKQIDSNSEITNQIQNEQNRLKQLYHALMKSWKNKTNQENEHKKLKKAYEKIKYLKEKLSKIEFQEVARNSQMERMKALLKDEQHALEIERICLQQHEATWKQRIQELEQELSNIRVSIEKACSSPILERTGPKRTFNIHNEIESLKFDISNYNLKKSTPSTQLSTKDQSNQFSKLATQTLFLNPNPIQKATFGQETSQKASLNIQSKSDVDSSYFPEEIETPIYSEHEEVLFVKNNSPNPIHESLLRTKIETVLSTSISKNELQILKSAQSENPPKTTSTEVNNPQKENTSKASHQSKSNRSILRELSQSQMNKNYESSSPDLIANDLFIKTLDLSNKMKNTSFEKTLVIQEEMQVLKHSQNTSSVQKFKTISRNDSTKSQFSQMDFVHGRNLRLPKEKPFIIYKDSPEVLRKDSIHL